MIELDQIDLLVFGLFLRAKMLHRKKSVMQVADATGLTCAEVNHARECRVWSLDVFHKLCEWQGEDGAIFLKRKSAKLAGA